MYLCQAGKCAIDYALELQDERMQDMLTCFGDSGKEVDDEDAEDIHEILGIDPDEDGGLFDSDDCDDCC